MSNTTPIQILSTHNVERFVMKHDYVNHKVVLVSIDHDNTIWVQETPQPASINIQWSTPQQVTFPSGKTPNLVEGNLSLVTCPFNSGLMCVGLTNSNEVFAFPIGHETAALTPAPSNVIAARRIAASDFFPGKRRNELLLVGDDINDKTALYRVPLNATQWPPVLDGDWTSWGRSDWSIPTFAYGPTTMTAIKTYGSTLYYCWCNKANLDWGMWHHLGTFTGTQENPQAVSWHVTPTTPQAISVFLKQENGTILYARQKGSDSSGWYHLAPASALTSTVTPVLVPWTNVSCVMGMKNGKVVYSFYWLKEDSVGSWRLAIAPKNVSAFCATMMKLDGRYDYIALVTVCKKTTGNGLWVNSNWFDQLLLPEEKK